MLSWKKSIVHVDCYCSWGASVFHWRRIRECDGCCLHRQTNTQTPLSCIVCLTHIHTCHKRAWRVHGDHRSFSISFHSPCSAAIKDGEVGLKAAAAWYSYPLLVFFFCSPEIINFKTSHFAIPALKWLITNSQKAKARSFTWSFPNTLKTRRLATKPQNIKDKIQTGGICINICAYQGWTIRRARIENMFTSLTFLRAMMCGGGYIDNGGAWLPQFHSFHLIL